MRHLALTANANMIQRCCPRWLTLPDGIPARSGETKGCRRAGLNEAQLQAGLQRAPATAEWCTARKMWPRRLAVLDEGSVLELSQSLLQFGLAIHHNWTVPGDRLLQRLA